MDQNFYPVRAGNDLKQLKEWIRDAKKEVPTQRFKVKKIITKAMMRDPYWNMRVKAGHEDQFMAYGSY